MPLILQNTIAQTSPSSTQLPQLTGSHPKQQQQPQQNNSNNHNNSVTPQLNIQTPQLYTILQTQTGQITPGTTLNQQLLTTKRFCLKKIR